tara:strand:+ start:772 stop:1629 length:858 start_codon:yes stop_codon:yes gene_type:complete
MKTSLWAWLSIKIKIISSAVGFTLIPLFLSFILFVELVESDQELTTPLGALLYLGSCCVLPLLSSFSFFWYLESFKEWIGWDEFDSKEDKREIKGHDLVFIEYLEIDDESIPFDDYLYESNGDSRVLQVSEKLLEKLLAAKEGWHIKTDKKEGITYLFEGKKGELFHADESGNLIVDPPEICSILRSFRYLAEIYNPENKDSYTILSVRSGSFAENSLAELVNEHISEGWRTVGGQSTSGGVNSYQMITQAMERDIPEKVVVPESIISRCEDIQAKVDEKPESDT